MKVQSGTGMQLNHVPGLPKGLRKLLHDSGSRTLGQALDRMFAGDLTKDQADTLRAAANGVGVDLHNVDLTSVMQFQADLSS